MDDLADKIKAATGFLSDLKANNNRDWFQAHKKDYEALVKNPGNQLGEEMAGQLSALTGEPMSHKLFRINRDVRFSKDKTPYNTHLHLSWSSNSGAAFMFGASPEYVTAGAGVFGLQKAALDQYRAKIDASGAALSENITSLIGQGFRMYPPELKRVPAPYDKDHPQAELLKRKSLALWQDFDGPLDAGALHQSFEMLLPIYRFLST